MVGHNGPELLGTKKDKRAKHPMKSFRGLGVLADLGGR
jgi:hypothetical protein